MSSLNELKSKVQPQEPAPPSGPQSLLQCVVGIIAGGGLNGLLESFQQKGLGQAVQSWIGTGANAPVSGEEVKESLGEEKIEEIAQGAGLSRDQTARGLAQVLPEIVDKLTPSGKLPDSAGLVNLLKTYFISSLGAKRPDSQIEPPK